MSALVLDAGAHVAIERGDRELRALLSAAQGRYDVRTNAVVLAQVWRDPAGRQARLARTLQAVDVRSVDAQLGREAGVLLGRAGTSDPVDATLVLICEEGDRVVTSDPQDIARLAALAGRRVDIIVC